MRKILIALTTTLVIVGGPHIDPDGAAQAAEPVPAPVVFVHGRNADPGVWGQLRADFEAAGYPAGYLFAWGYDSSQSTNEVLTYQLAAYVDDVLQETGASQVDLVAHSLGSLPTRWYIKFGGGQSVVRSWISLAGPNHGTSLAWWCALWDQGCKDMTPGSYVLSNLNEGDESPGHVRYATLWSECDEQIGPPDSTTVDGAVNHQLGCLEHNELLTDDGVSVLVRDFLMGTPGGAIVGLAGKCLDVNGANSADGTGIQLWGCNGTPAQHWTHVGQTWRALGKCLDVDGTADGASVQLWTCNGTSAQNWVAGVDGSLLNPGSGKCLDISGSDAADGAPAIIWTCHGGANQRWTPLD